MENVAKGSVMKWVNQEKTVIGDLECYWWSYFHNKMMLLLMLIEHPHISRNTISVEKQRFFLFDLEHHFLPPKAPQKYRNAFRWLGRYLNQFPDVSPARIRKAIEMAGIIYEAFGFRMGERVEAKRIDRESMGSNGHEKN